LSPEDLMLGHIRLPYRSPSACSNLLTVKLHAVGWRENLVLGGIPSQRRNNDRHPDDFDQG
jgi:hypothetical protein